MKKKFLAGLLLASAPAFASLFGVPSSPCAPGSTFNKMTGACVYCASGTNNPETSNTLQCIGPLTMGNHCPLGKNPHFNEKTKSCVYCPEGKYLDPTVEKCL